VKDGAKKAKAEAYRRLLMGAGEKVFAEHGFDAARIQDIAQLAGLSLGTLYTVFPGKTEIYTAIQSLRGAEILHEIQGAVQGHPSALEATLAGVAAYARALVERPDYLRMHLREGLSWTQRSALRTGQEVATWERGMTLAVELLRLGSERGLLHADNPPELLLKMMIAAHQVQLQEWVDARGSAREQNLDSGARRADIDALVRRMQDHFRRAFVREPHQAARVEPSRGAPRQRAAAR
jgi:AcrR family transcriptional regulator